MNGPVGALHDKADHGAGGLVAEVVDAEWLLARPAAWDRLVETAGYPNLHFGRRVVSAHLAHGLAGGELRFLVVRRGDRLAALLPFRPGGARIGIGRRANVPFTSPYVTNATPLVSEDEFEDTIDALVRALGTASEHRLWLFALFSLESRVGRALLAALKRQGYAHQTVSSFRRAILDRTGDATLSEGRVGRHRRKDLRRRRRRLREMGRLEAYHFEGGEGLAGAVESFLALELGGWKGARGTALANRDNTAAFARSWFADEPGPVSARADLLALDGRPIAVSLALVCRGTACLLKTAYDEQLGAYAPGLLLEDQIVRSLHETGFATRLDSASQAGSVLEDFYPDRETIADLLIAADTGVAGAHLARLAERERFRRAAIDRIKRLRGQLVALWRPGSSRPTAES